MTVQLQGIGRRQAKPAGQIQIGDQLMWNFGYVSTVTAIIKETERQIVIEEEYESGTYQRRMGKDSLVAIVSKDARA